MSPGYRLQTTISPIKSKATGLVRLLCVRFPHRFTFPIIEAYHLSTAVMTNPDDLRPEDMDPDEFKEIMRDAALVLGLDYVARYRKAGCPYGRTVETVMLWARYGQTARRN